MRKFLLAMAIVVALSAQSLAQLPSKAGVPKFLQNISVTIKSGRGEGSGVSFNRDGVTFIWTAAHVVDNLRTTRTVIDSSTGTKKFVVEFKDAKIVKQLVEDGRLVGRIEMDAEVIRYSNADDGQDLALLRVRKKEFIKTSAVFYDGSIPSIGTPLFHVGSLLGQMGANSMTDGIMSQHGRLINKKVYDQTTVTAFPGSSGGGVYTHDGRYVGMLVRGSGEGFNLIVPVRRIRSWAKSAGIEWAMDSTIDMPEDISKIQIEDIGVTFARGAAKK